MRFHYPGTAYRAKAKARNHVFDGSTVGGISVLSLIRYKMMMAGRETYSLIWDPNHGRGLLILTYTKFSLTSACTNSPGNADEDGRLKITQRWLKTKIKTAESSPKGGVGSASWFIP
jgi:hypothetical protein